MLEVIKFSATWCRPCKVYDPIITSVVDSLEGVSLTRVDIEENPTLAAQFSVQSVPYTVFKSGDTVLGGFAGATTKDKLHKIITSFQSTA